MSISSYNTVHDLLKSVTKDEWAEIEASFITTKRTMESNFSIDSHTVPVYNDEKSEVNQLFKRIKRAVKKQSKSQDHTGYLVAKITSEKKEYENTLIDLHERLLYNPENGDVRQVIDFITETGLHGQAEFPSINEQIISVQQQLDTASTDIYATFSLLDKTDNDDPNIYEALTFTSIDHILPYTLSINYNEAENISRILFITNLLAELYEISFYEDEKQLILNDMAMASDYSNEQYFNEFNQIPLTEPTVNNEFDFETSLYKFLNELPVFDDGIDH